ncbi:hypothetical protein [Nitrosomonas marina]|nr:hypothetical protein [Nitrosomonas marina]
MNNLKIEIKLNTDIANESKMTVAGFIEGFRIYEPLKRNSSKVMGNIQ